MSSDDKLSQALLDAGTTSWSTRTGTTSVSELVIVAVRREMANPLIDVLRDWSRLGLVRTLHVVDVDSRRADDLRVPCLVVDRGGVHGAALQDELAQRVVTERVRVAALTALGEERTVSVTEREALDLVQTLRNGLAGLEPQQVHLVATSVQSRPDPQQTGWIGWHNLVVAPENALAPGAGVAPVQRDDETLLTAQVAAAVCSVLGAWADVEGSPLDTRAMPPGDSVSLVRTFSRHLSAAAVESELFDRLTDMRHGYPVPTVEGSSTLAIEDEAPHVRDMANAVLHKHAFHLGPREREQVRRKAPRKIGLFEALRMFFSFLWQAIRNAPRAFLDSVVTRVSAAAAGAVGGVAFGADSSYSVVVNGVKADGTPASWPEIDEALEAVSQQISPRQGMAESANADLSEVWRDYVEAGMTLFDGGKRGQDLEPRMLSSRRAVITTPSSIAPDPSEEFTLPENLRAYLKERAVSSYDPVSVELLKLQIRGVGESTPHLTQMAREAHRGLGEWYDRHRKSYTGVVGGAIATNLARVRQEVVDQLGQLRSADEAGTIPDRIEEQQRRLGRRLKRIALLALVLVLVTVAAAVLGPPTWIFAVGVSVVIVVVWVFSSTWMFLKGQKELFALIHRREELIAMREVLHRNLLAALDDLRRLVRAYRQYLDWTRSFGRFVQHPLGEVDDNADQRALIGTGLPLNHRFGEARPDDQVIEDTTALMRRDLFGVGWATRSWDAFLADVPREVGPDAYRIREDAGLLFSDLNVARRPVLSLWADAVQRRQTWAGARDGLVADVEVLLEGSARELGSKVLARVVSRSATGTERTQAFNDFMGGLHAVTDRDRGSFARGVFTDQAQGSQAWEVAQTAPQQSRHGLGRSVVVTQVSAGFPPRALRFGSAEAAGPEQSGQRWSDDDDLEV